MKLMFASDIHGAFPSCVQMLKRFDEEKAERLIILGDILYHGPRNDLPAGYAPKEVIRLLNQRKNKLFCIRGNCDTEVDQMVLEFPILAEYALLFLEGKQVFVTHGHNFNTSQPPLIADGDILIHGHTHIQTIDTSNGYVYINPGSVSLPKDNNEKSYMTYENGLFQVKTLAEGTVQMEYSIK